MEIKSSISSPLRANCPSRVQSKSNLEVFSFHVFIIFSVFPRIYNLQLPGTAAGSYVSKITNNPRMSQNISGSHGWWRIKENWEDYDVHLIFVFREYFDVHLISCLQRSGWFSNSATELTGTKCAGCPPPRRYHSYILYFALSFISAHHQKL